MWGQGQSEGNTRKSNPQDLVLKDFHSFHISSYPGSRGSFNSNLTRDRYFGPKPKGTETEPKMMKYLVRGGKKQ